MWRNVAPLRCSFLLQSGQSLTLCWQMIALGRLGPAWCRSVPFAFTLVPDMFLVFFFQLATSEDQFGFVAYSVEWRHVPAKTVISWIITGFDLISPSAPPWLFEVNFVGSWIGMHPVETAEFVSLFFSTSPGVPNRAPSIEGYSRYQGAFDQQISSRELAMNKKTIHKWVMKKILVG